MAYAAAISLIQTILRLEIPINIRQITHSVCEELLSLRSMLQRLDDESSRSIDRSVINEVDAKIRDTVWKAEDVLESYVLHPSSQRLDEKGVENEIDSFLKKVKKLREEYHRVLQKPLPEEEEEDSDAVSPLINKSTTVGLSDLSEEIINKLLDSTSTKILSLVGMAGIGKTHLATQIYHNPIIVKHFDYRVLVRVGPKYQIKNILVDMVAHIECKPRDLFKEKDEYTLNDLLLNRLRGKRYLIVLDDVWTMKALWYFISLLKDFGYGNGRGYILTTRLQEVAEHGMNKNYQMPFLNNEESWNLLWQNVFVAEKSFPPQLEKPGRKIAEMCEGLPLLILAVANILCGLDKTQEYWEKVAEKKTTTFTDAYEQIYEVLLPSYEYLPQHLKASFLYMGVFPQSCEIPRSKLTNLWIVEDFQEEDIYMKPLEDLVSKSLAIVCKRSSKSYKRIKSSKLHSAYWYLCVKEAKKNKLFHVLNKLTDVSKDYIESHRRLSFQNNILFGIREVYGSMAAVTSSTTRSLLCTGEDHQYPVPICFNMTLLKVLDALAIRFYEFPNEVLKLLQLRYLSLTHNGELPSSISNLQLLQYLILRPHHNIKFLQRDSSYFPDVIWDMQELRHLQIMGSNLPDPCKEVYLPKLETLYLKADSCRESVFRSIPNLRKLGIKIELQPDAAETFSFSEHIRVLDGLQSLKCVVVNPRERSQAVALPEQLSNLYRGLQKLSLNGLGYSWKYMREIGSLRHLKVLKLRCSAFQGPEWEVRFWQFKNLEFLLLEDIDLVNWTVSDYGGLQCFRSLRHLIVRHCYKLKMIPPQIGYAPKLERMEVDDCSPSVVASAHQIKNKCKSSDLQLVINSSWNL